MHPVRRVHRDGRVVLRHADEPSPDAAGFGVHVHLRGQGSQRRRPRDYRGVLAQLHQTAAAVVRQGRGRVPAAAEAAAIGVRPGGCLRVGVGADLNVPGGDDLRPVPQLRRRVVVQRRGHGRIHIGREPTRVGGRAAAGDVPRVGGDRHVAARTDDGVLADVRRGRARLVRRRVRPADADEPASVVAGGGAGIGDRVGRDAHVAGCGQNRGSDVRRHIRGDRHNRGIVVRADEAAAGTGGQRRGNTIARRNHQRGQRDAAWPHEPLRAMARIDDRARQDVDAELMDAVRRRRRQVHALRGEPMDRRRAQARCAEGERDRAGRRVGELVTRGAARRVEDVIRLAVHEVGEGAIAGPHQAVNRCTGPDGVRRGHDVAGVADLDRVERDRRVAIERLGERAGAGEVGRDVEPRGARGGDGVRAVIRATAADRERLADLEALGKPVRARDEGRVLAGERAGRDRPREREVARDGRRELQRAGTGDRQHAVDDAALQRGDRRAATLGAVQNAFVHREAVRLLVAVGIEEVDAVVVFGGWGDGVAAGVERGPHIHLPGRERSRRRHVVGHGLVVHETVGVRDRAVVRTHVAGRDGVHRLRRQLQLHSPLVEDAHRVNRTRCQAGDREGRRDRPVRDSIAVEQVVRRGEGDRFAVGVDVRTRERSPERDAVRVDRAACGQHVQHAVPPGVGHAGCVGVGLRQPGDGRVAVRLVLDHVAGLEVVVGHRHGVLPRVGRRDDIRRQ